MTTSSTNLQYNNTKKKKKKKKKSSSECLQPDFLKVNSNPKKNGSNIKKVLLKKYMLHLTNCLIRPL